jgi:hypothetical protein
MEGLWREEEADDKAVSLVGVCDQAITKFGNQILEAEKIMLRELRA